VKARKSYTSIVIEQEIAAARTLVWETLLDFLETSAEGYLVEGNPSPHGLGATLEQVSPNCNRLEEVISFEPPWRRVYEVTIEGVPLLQGTSMIIDRGDNSLLVWSIVIDPFSDEISETCLEQIRSAAKTTIEIIATKLESIEK